jgi:hypothetical protein
VSSSVRDQKEGCRHVPRAKAIRWDNGATQRVIGLIFVFTLFRNPTMPAIAVQRCWHNLCVVGLGHVTICGNDTVLCLPPVYLGSVRTVSRAWRKGTRRVWVRGGRRKIRDTGHTAVG